MKEEVKEQLNIIKRECFKLSQIVNFDRLRLEYNKNKKYNDEGQLDMIHIQHLFSS